MIRHLPILQLGYNYLHHFTPCLNKGYFYLFCYTLTPPLCGIHCDSALLRVVQVTNLSPKWNKASSRVLADRARISLRTESVESSVISVSLCIFANVERMFSKHITHLVIQTAHFTAFTCTDFSASYCFL